jgi:hypothetical protein
MTGWVRSIRMGGWAMVREREDEGTGVFLGISALKGLAFSMVTKR